MLQFIEFIKRYRFFFTFLLLEIFCFTLIISSNQFAAGWYFNFSSCITGSLTSFSHSVTEYFDLKKVNEQLALQNARLMEEDERSCIIIDTIQHPIIRKNQFEFIPAKVIGNSINKRDNYLIINRGTNSNIHKNMGVVAPDGIVGIIIGVSENFSIVMSLLHKASNISGRIVNENIVGSVVWNGENPHKATLLNIPQHYKIQSGNEVVTSGYSLFFPEGIKIGTINHFELSDDGSLYNIELDLSTDFQSLSWVYVIENLMQEEAETLLESSKIVE